MTAADVVIARLLTIGAVTAITGNRWWLVKLPQKPIYPAGRVQLIDEPGAYHLRGPGNTRRARVQVDAYVDEATAAAAGQNPYTVLTALTEAIEGDGLGEQASGLSGWKGEIGSPPVIVRGCFLIDSDGPRYDFEELRSLRMRMDYYVWSTR